MTLKTTEDLQRELLAEIRQINQRQAEQARQTAERDRQDAIKAEIAEVEIERAKAARLAKATGNTAQVSLAIALGRKKRELEKQLVIPAPEPKPDLETLKQAYQTAKAAHEAAMTHGRGDNQVVRAELARQELARARQAFFGALSELGIPITDSETD